MQIFLVIDLLLPDDNARDHLQYHLYHHFPLISGGIGPLSAVLHTRFPRSHQALSSLVHSHSPSRKDSSVDRGIIHQRTKMSPNHPHLHIMFPSWGLAVPLSLQTTSNKPVIIHIATPGVALGPYVYSPTRFSVQFLDFPRITETIYLMMGTMRAFQPFRISSHPFSALTTDSDDSPNQPHLPRRVHQSTSAPSLTHQRLLLDLHMILHHLVT